MNINIVTKASSIIGMLLSVAVFAQSPAPLRNDPAAVLQKYLDAVNSADYDALVALLSDDMAPFSYRTCTPQMKPKECLATFVNDTILKRHGSLVSPSAKVKGDAIIAVIEVRHDGTRAAHVPRLIGVDTITVKNNKIVSFEFVQYPNDEWNKKLAAFYAAQPAAAPNRP